MKRFFSHLTAVMSACLVAAPFTWSATNNTGNNPTFLVVQMVSNGWKLHAGQSAPNTTIDIGVDVGADGTYEYWMSEDPTIVREDRTNQEEIFVDNLTSQAGWMNVLIALEEYAGETVKLRIVDKSPDAYIAVNSIRLNNADGIVVKNNVPNGWFDAAANLEGWTVVEGSATKDQLITTDTEFRLSSNTDKFFNTQIDGNATIAVIESAPFVLTPVSSFVYGTFAGPVSAAFDKPGAWLTDNGLMVFVDVGTTTTDPNGRYDEATDVPLKGILFDDSDEDRITLQASILNTSGLEGRRAKIVAVDNDQADGIGLDSIRHNYDTSIIRNGNFEEGFENSYPAGFISDPNNAKIPIQALSSHPSGSLPGWTQVKSANAAGEWTFFGWPGANFSREGRVWVASGSTVGQANNDVGVRANTGIELHSNVFVIQPIPNPSSSVFTSFDIGQTPFKIQPNGLVKDVQLQVDLNGNGAFTDATDFAYKVRAQGGGWNREQYANGGIDEWGYPQYRFYIQPAHQGKQGRFYVIDELTSQWAWIGVDDFYFWDGTSADLAFPNSDFEMGNMTNWEEELVGGLGTWLSGNEVAQAAGFHNSLNDHIAYADGNYSADSANSGDGPTGFLQSVPFTIPTAATSIFDWEIR